VAIFSFPGGDEARLDPVGTMDQILVDSGIAADDIDNTVFDNALFGFNSTEGTFELPGRVGFTSVAGGVQMVVASVQPGEGVVRVVVVLADSRELIDQVQAEVLDSLIFDRVASPTA
jgi:hypothetical protein